MALIYYRGLRLPNKRVELYQVCIETLLEHWVLQRIEEEKLKDKSEILEILSSIATIFNLELHVSTFKT